VTVVVAVAYPSTGSAAVVETEMEAVQVPS